MRVRLCNDAIGCTLARLLLVNWMLDLGSVGIKLNSSGIHWERIEQLGGYANRWVEVETANEALLAREQDQ